MPAGLQELTIAFDPERAVGGQLEAGATVGIVISYEPFELATSGTPIGESSDPNGPIALVAPEADGSSKTPNTTHLTLNQILVTAVQLSQNDAERVTETQQRPTRTTATSRRSPPTSARRPVIGCW